MKIQIEGDHTGYHCGSDAVYQVILKDALSYGEVVGSEEDFDLLVVNGEGSMHHDSKACKRKMEKIRQTIDSGKRATLVNTVWEENPREYAEILKRCDRVIAREICSARELAKVGVDAQVYLDAAYSCEIDDVEPYDFDGAVLVTDFFSREFGTFAKVTGAWAKRFVYIDLKEWSWSHLVRSMSTASMLITGRHHAVYASCKARLPFVALTGNTHKITGLIETAQSDIPIFTEFADLKANLSWPTKNTESYERLFDWMEAQPKWTMSL